MQTTTKLFMPKTNSVTVQVYHNGLFMKKAKQELSSQLQIAIQLDNKELEESVRNKIDRLSAGDYSAGEGLHFIGGGCDLFYDASQHRVVMMQSPFLNH